MTHRVNIIACVLLLSPLAAPASHAGDQRSPVGHHQVTSQARSSAFAGLGHEGGGLRGSPLRLDAFAGLGHEGGGLMKNGGSPARPVSSSS